MSLGGLLLAVIAYLRLPPVFVIPILLFMLSILLWQWRLMLRDGCAVLQFDGEQWWQLASDSEQGVDWVPRSVAVRLLFKSNFLLVLGFRDATRPCGYFTRWRRLYLTRDNCPQSLLRAVCRAIP